MVIMNNEKGGIISKLFIIPMGAALMVGFFFLGYYVGKYQSKSPALSEVMQPLPDVAPQESPKQEEFTFYKTLTDKGNKTVSIDLRPKTSNSGSISEKKQVEPEPVKSVPVQRTDMDKDKSPEMKTDKSASPAPKEAAKASAPVVKERALSGIKLRYTLQIASYQDKQAAEDEVKKMKKQGYAAFIVSSLLPEKGTWYRVRLGSFTNKVAAEKLQKEINAKAGVSPIVVIE
jgi:cell division septation protein DedD